MRSYSVNGNATNTPSATLPLITLISATSIRPKLLAIEMGSDAAPADNAVKYVVQRCTTTGTVGSSITPVAIDPADPAAVTTSGLATFSVGPTLTASAFLLQWAQNQRQAYRWWAYDETRALVMPATSGNGLAILPTVAAVPFNAVVSLVFSE